MSALVSTLDAAFGCVPVHDAHWERIRRGRPRSCYLPRIGMRSLNGRQCSERASIPADGAPVDLGRFGDEALEC